MSDHMGFYLSDIGRLIRKRFDVAAKGVGVTGPQWRVLFNVWRSPGINQGQLADRLEVEPITTCRMVDRLVQAGLVERRRDPKDRRVWRIYLTDAALPLIDRLRGIGDQVVSEATSSLTTEEAQYLRELLIRMRDHLLDEPSTPARDIRHG